MADRPPLIAERLTRLRTWATRHHPDSIHGYAAHLFDGSCPWCAHSEPGTDATPDGNAHDLAVELIDEITRLRVSNMELAQAAGMDLKGGREFEPYRELAERVSASVVPAGWGRGTPVQVAGHGPLLWRVAPPEQQERDGLITVTCGAKTLRCEPGDLTYAGQAPLVAGERVHRSPSHQPAGWGPADWGTVTLVDPGFDPPGIFVRWDDDHGDEAAVRRTLERPVDVATKWGVGRKVTHRSGWDGHIVEIVGALAAVAEEPPCTGRPTWHHISDLIPRQEAP